jgi:hypothetical protein
MERQRFLEQVDLAGVIGGHRRQRRDGRSERLHVLHRAHEVLLEGAVVPGALADPTPARALRVLPGR